MILREATKDDLHPLLALTRKAWTQIGISFPADLSRLRNLADGRHRTVVLFDGPDLVASLTALPGLTDQGPSFEIVAFVIDQDRPDRLKLTDALALYALNIGVSEGCRIVISRRRASTLGIVYGRDKLRMDALDVGRTPTGDVAEVYQTGDPQAMMKAILQRRPEWRLSL